MCRLKSNDCGMFDTTQAFGLRHDPHTTASRYYHRQFKDNMYLLTETDLYYSLQTRQPSLLPTGT